MDQTLAQLLAAPVTRLADLQRHIAALDGAERVRQCRALGGKQQARLYELADAGGVGPELMVSSAGNGEPVRWMGRNSLPLFSNFEKHFVRQDGRVVGFNYNWHGFASGWGYFTCSAVEDQRGGLLIDYTHVPERAPAGWPAPRSNARGLSHFIFKDLHDFVRRVSDDVVIGFATRLGKPLGQYFVLARP